MRPILLVQAALAIDSTDRFVFFSQHLFERFGRPWLPVYTCFNPLSATRASLGPVDERARTCSPYLSSARSLLDSSIQAFAFDATEDTEFFVYSTRRRQRD